MQSSSVQRPDCSACNLFNKGHYLICLKYVNVVLPSDNTSQHCSVQIFSPAKVRGMEVNTFPWYEHPGHGSVIPIRLKRNLSIIVPFVHTDMVVSPYH